ncbi:MAG: hypothetical protein IJJ01_05515 [Firmicutes bacterium]|nr:hypothetical protein [Bacillota bacterium]
MYKIIITDKSGVDDFQCIDSIENEENCEFTGPCIIEGIVHKTLPIVCVQWHPELMYKAPVSGAADYGKLLEYFAFLIRKTNDL